MRLPYLLVLLVSLVRPHFIYSPHQAALGDLDHPVEREKVRGHNPAYYSRVKAVDQLFEILEFTVSPNPPLADHRIFFYLRGTTGVRDLPELANATLQLWANRANFDDEPEYTVTMNISDCRPFTVRNEDDLTYGGPLVPGINEMVGDLWILPWPDRGLVVLDVEAIARLPDERVLFAFEARVEYTV